MKTLLIRDVPDEVHDILVAQAERERRSKEKQALYLIETSLARPAETCGELLERMWAEPPPDVDPDAVDAYLATRGKRSNRPA